MADELRLGTLGDEIFGTAASTPGDTVLQGDGMTVPIPRQAGADDLPLPPPPFLSATDDLPTPPHPFVAGDGMTVPIPLRGGDLDILSNGPSIPIP
jgi:hypothetical protein